MKNENRLFACLQATSSFQWTVEKAKQNIAGAIASFMSLRWLGLKEESQFAFVVCRGFEHCWSFELYQDTCAFEF